MWRVPVDESCESQPKKKINRHIKIYIKDSNITTKIVKKGNRSLKDKTMYS